MYKIKNMEERFESFQEFVYYISSGGELEFKYKEEEYSIVQTNKGIHIGNVYDEKSEKTYMIVEDLGEYIIGEESLKNVITNVEVIMRLF